MTPGLRLGRCEVFDRESSMCGDTTWETSLISITPSSPPSSTPSQLVTRGDKHSATKPVTHHTYTASLGLYWNHFSSVLSAVIDKVGTLELSYQLITDISPN